MMKEDVVKILKSKNYIISNGISNKDLNMQVWKTKSRVIVIKEYRTESSFLNWLQNDQPAIGELYTNLDNKFKNNLYYFMIINFNPESMLTRLEINKAQKNEFVCKKYVIKNNNDIQKIPFLKETKENHRTFNFDEQFKYDLVEINKDEQIEKIHLSNSDTISFLENTNNILRYYFDSYITDNLNQIAENQSDDLINYILKKEDRYDYK